MSNNTTSAYEEMLAQQVVCYGLPYGTFGLICWILSTASSLLLYVNFPLFSPWKWRKPHQSQALWLALISSALTIGPTIHTCIQCKNYWPFTVIAIGQLSPWSFKIFNDGLAFITKSNERDKDAFASNTKRNEPSEGRDLFYIIFGAILSCILGFSGWAGMTALYIGLICVSHAVSKLIWAVYLTPIVFAAIAFCCCHFRGWALFAVIAYFSATTHILGSHLIFSEISGNWGGFPLTKL
ncbi:27385_t:CDS:2, partial [Gigaspora margarita]